MKTIIGRIEKENRHNRERNSLDSEKELLRSVWKGRISAFFIDFLVQQVGNIKIFPTFAPRKRMATSLSTRRLVFCS